MKTGFTAQNSIVRKIWGKADTVLFIFAGAAAEFGLNKAVDWLYFTGKLPADPLGRLFSTVEYSRQIIFSEEEQAFAAIDQITAIHREVEKSRGMEIPDWAYRDVLFLLIDYSIRSYELLENKLNEAEKGEVFDVFLRVGQRMQLLGLPGNYAAWIVERDRHMENNLARSEFTNDLYKQYKIHLGNIRYTILLQVQLQVTPARVSRLLQLKEKFWFLPILRFYIALRYIKLQQVFRTVLLPVKYKARIKALDRTGELTNPL